jgi:hypothetical protein
MEKRMSGSDLANPTAFVSPDRFSPGPLSDIADGWERIRKLTPTGNKATC